MYPRSCVLATVIHWQIERGVSSWWMDARYGESDRAGQQITRVKLQIKLEMEPDRMKLIFDVFVVFFPDYFPMSLPGSSIMEKVQLHMNNLPQSQPHLAGCALSSREISAGKQVRHRHLPCQILRFIYLSFRMRCHVLCFPSRYFRNKGGSYV